MGYSFGVFGLVFFLLLPLFLIGIHLKPFNRSVLLLNHIWTRLFFFFSCMRIKIEWESPIDTTKQYVFCSNHASLIDIPTFGFIPIPFVFVGKMSISKVPFFGYVYKKLHITVDRKSIKSKGDAFKKSIHAIKEKKSLAIFPEGGIINSNTNPRLNPFKDGAFRTAIETQVPIVPVTMPFNWKVFPDDGSFYLRNIPNKIIFHTPIETTGMTLKDVDALRNKTFSIIENEIKKYFPY